MPTIMPYGNKRFYFYDEGEQVLQDCDLNIALSIDSLSIRGKDAQWVVNLDWSEFMKIALNEIASGGYEVDRSMGLSAFIDSWITHDGIYILASDVVKKASDRLPAVAIELLKTANNISGCCSFLRGYYPACLIFDCIRRKQKEEPAIESSEVKVEDIVRGWMYNPEPTYFMKSIARPTVEWDFAKAPIDSVPINDYQQWKDSNEQGEIR